MAKEQTFWVVQEYLGHGRWQPVTETLAVTKERAIRRIIPDFDYHSLRKHGSMRCVRVRLVPVEGSRPND